MCNVQTHALGGSITPLYMVYDTQHPVTVHHSQIYIVHGEFLKRFPEYEFTEDVSSFTVRCHQSSRMRTYLPYLHTKL